MADTPKNGGGNMLSSYIGRWMSLVMLLLLVTLAAAALFFEPDYPAHVPLRIGVCAFDSVTAGPALRSFASTVREQEGGDISWVWLGPGREPAGCDFYLMTSLQMLAAREKSMMDCLLLSTPRIDGSLSMGVVVVRAEAEPDWSRTAFTSSVSATGFISPLAAIAEGGVCVEDLSYETAFRGMPGLRGGCSVRSASRQVWRWRHSSRGTQEDSKGEGSIGQGELRVLFTGPELPEIVLVIRSCRPKNGSRVDSPGDCPGSLRRLSDPLSREMARLGMVLFRPPAAGELEMLGSVPLPVREEAGYHFP